MSNLFHIIGKLLHTIDRTMEATPRNRWTDQVDEKKHKANKK